MSVVVAICSDLKLLIKLYKTEWMYDLFSNFPFEVYLTTLFSLYGLKTVEIDFAIHLGNGDKMLK